MRAFRPSPGTFAAVIEIRDIVGVALLAGIAATLVLWLIRSGRMP